MYSTLKMERNGEWFYYEAYSHLSQHLSLGVASSDFNHPNGSLLQSVSVIMQVHNYSCSYGVLGFP